MNSNPLESLRIASPCTADWNAMKGDNKVRFCDQCSLNVYDLSAMTAAEAQNILASNGSATGSSKPPCVRFYRRADGTVMTRDCPVGLRTLKQSWRNLRVRTTAAVMLLFGLANRGLSQEIIPAARKMEREPLTILVSPVVTKSLASVPEHRMGVPSVYNYAPFMSDLQAKIKSNFKAYDLLTPRRNCSVTFYIKKDGSFVDMRLDKPSGNPALDKAALEAIRDSAPAPVPLTEWPEPTGIQFTFDSRLCPNH